MSNRTRRKLEQARPPMAPVDEVQALKALAYDTVVQIQALQQRIGQINQRILELTGQTPPPAAAPEPSGD